MYIRTYVHVHAVAGGTTLHDIFGGSVNHLLTTYTVHDQWMTYMHVQ